MKDKEKTGIVIPFPNKRPAQFSKPVMSEEQRLDRIESLVNKLLQEIVDLKRDSKESRKIVSSITRVLASLKLS